MLVVCLTILVPSTCGAKLQASWSAPCAASKGASKVVIPEEGWKLFAKFKQINVEAMEHPKILQGFLVEQDILRVKGALQKIYVHGKVLPDCITTTTWIGRVGSAYCVYDILRYLVYGDGGGVSLSSQRGFAAYPAAYEAGIHPAHLRVLDKAIASAHSVRQPYVLDGDFREAFAWLTRDVYKDGMYVTTYGDLPAKFDPKHVGRLAPLVRWLEGEAKVYLPKGVGYCILRYAFGGGFSIYDRLCRLCGVLCPTHPPQAQGVVQDLSMVLDTVNDPHPTLDNAYINAVYLPYALAKTYAGQPVRSLEPTQDENIYEYLQFYALSPLCRHINTTPYLHLLQEGWTQYHGLYVERSLSKHIPVDPDHQTPNLVGLGCVLGGCGLAKVAQVAQCVILNVYDPF